MRGPHESFCHFGVSFIVNLQATVIHRPRPRPLDDPALGEDFECVRMDPFDDVHSDAHAVAELAELRLESCVAPYLLHSSTFRFGCLDCGDAARVVARRRGADRDGDDQAECVDEPEAFPSGDLLAGVIALAGLGNRRGRSDAAGVDDRRGRIRDVSFHGADRYSKPICHGLPGPVA